MTPDMCIFHYPCADGAGAAYAVRRRFNDVELVPGIYGQDPPDVTDKHVLLVDFSYKNAVLMKMAEKAKSITVLDHHKTAQQDLQPFMLQPTFTNSEGKIEPVTVDNIDDAVKRAGNIGKIRALFDMERSGAVMAWEFCNPTLSVPRLLKYVEDRDLWRFKMPQSREVAAFIFSFPYEMEIWSNMVATAQTPNGLSHIVSQGAAIERKHLKDIDELLSLTRRVMVIGGVPVPVANLPYTMASDAAGKMAEGVPFAATYYDVPDGRIFSLRSRDGGADVSEIAKAYGGGGHKNAAGFKAALGWEGDGATY